MKKIIVFLLSLTIALSPSIVWASAAEKWDYEVKPDTNQRLKVTGYKVDQFGDAVNDKKYTTTIDPKTTANKQKMGGVAIAKLLKKANWASAGVEAFQALLQGIDWVMDPAAQSIWRYKIQEEGCTYCSYDVKVTVNNSPNNPFYSIQSAEAEVERITGRGKDRYVYEWSQIKDQHGKVIRLDLTLKLNGGSLGKYAYAEIIRENEPEKEYLTPEAAADYANRTHPDFTNPHYKDRANPLYKPEILENLWKPHNKWEEENSPTVQEVKRELEKANPDSKDDTIKENEPNPETGEKSFSLPAFCNWATAVCDYFEWAKQEPELEKEEIEIQEPKEFDNSVFTKDRFQVSRQCPAPEQHTITLSGVSVSFSFDMTPLCTVLEMARPALVACSYLYAAYIVIGAARNG